MSNELLRSLTPPARPAKSLGGSDKLQPADLLVNLPFSHPESSTMCLALCCIATPSPGRLFLCVAGHMIKSAKPRREDMSCARHEPGIERGLSSTVCNKEAHMVGGSGTQAKSVLRGPEAWGAALGSDVAKKMQRVRQRGRKP
eukprot:5015344-Pyramimonas_sp.AAC.1